MRTQRGGRVVEIGGSLVGWTATCFLTGIRSGRSGCALPYTIYLCCIVIGFSRAGAKTKGNPGWDSELKCLIGQGGLTRWGWVAGSEGERRLPIGAGEKKVRWKREREKRKERED